LYTTGLWEERRDSRFSKKTQIEQFLSAIALPIKGRYSEIPWALCA